MLKVQLCKNWSILLDYNNPLSMIEALLLSILILLTGRKKLESIYDYVHPILHGEVQKQKLKIGT